jgi:mRNA interferase MazF
VNQGDIWLAESADEKARPVLVVTRSEAIPVLNAIVVAPLTTTLRDIPTCIPVGPAERVGRDSVASFDQLRCLPKARLTRRLGALDASRRAEMCAALAAMTDC